MTIPEDIRMDENKTGQATIPADLEERIMNPCIAKNEQEWWAQREITRLRGEIERLRRGEMHTCDYQELLVLKCRLAALDAELKAKQTELEAWFSIFGTQQLSHASARLEAAENKVQRLEAELAKARKDEQKTIEDFTATCNNLRSRLVEREKRIEKLEDLGRIVLDWLQCDLYNHGPGPMGGFQSRVDVVEAALAEDK